MKNKLWILFLFLAIIFFSHVHIKKIIKEKVKREGKKSEVILKRLETNGEKQGANGKPVHFVPVKKDVQTLQQVNFKPKLIFI